HVTDEPGDVADALTDLVDDRRTNVLGGAADRPEQVTELLGQVTEEPEHALNRVAGPGLQLVPRPGRKVPDRFERDTENALQRLKRGADNTRDSGPSAGHDLLDPVPHLRPVTLDQCGDRLNDPPDHLQRAFDDRSHVRPDRLNPTKDVVPELAPKRKDKINHGLDDRPDRQNRILNDLGDPRPRLTDRSKDLLDRVDDRRPVLRPPVP